MTVDDLMQHAKMLCKNEHCFLETDNGDKYLLCGSPLAFDEVIEEKIMLMIHNLVARFNGNDSNYDYDSDLIATTRDDCIRQLIISALGVKDVIYGTIEF